MRPREFVGAVPSLHDRTRVFRAYGEQCFAVMNKILARGGVKAVRGKIHFRAKMNAKQQKCHSCCFAGRCARARRATSLQRRHRPHGPAQMRRARGWNPQPAAAPSQPRTPRVANCAPQTRAARAATAPRARGGAADRAGAGCCAQFARSAPRWLATATRSADADAPRCVRGRDGARSCTRRRSREITFRAPAPRRRRVMERADRRAARYGTTATQSRGVCGV